MQKLKKYSRELDAGLGTKKSFLEYKQKKNCAYLDSPEERDENASVVD